MSAVKPPVDEHELLKLAKEIAGLSLSELAQTLGLKQPVDMHYAKGWQGELLEIALGATAGNQAKPDFFHLGIELKTIPVNANGLPRETTYICTAPLINDRFEQWHTSRVYQKLKRVLWIPIEAEPTIPWHDRRIGMPLLWSPNATEENSLCKDWEELTEFITLGQLDKLTAHQGVALQLRPKAANSKISTNALDEEGRVTKTSPRGFYLRTSFTTEILRKAYVW